MIRVGYSEGASAGRYQATEERKLQAKKMGEKPCDHRRFVKAGKRTHPSSVGEKICQTMNCGSQGSSAVNLPEEKTDLVKIGP